MHASRFVSSLLLSLALAFSTAAVAGPTAPSAATAAAAAERVNINTADAATLDRVLVNVGPAKARAIVEYRKVNGPFRSIDQLALVKGIGLKTIERNRSRILLGALPAARPVANGGRGPSRAAAMQR